MEKPSPTAFSAPVVAPRRAWSIARRLAVLYTVSAFAMLFLATSFLYWVLVSSLRKEGNNTIADVIGAISGILKEHPGEIDPLRDEVEVEGPARRFAKYYARVIEPSGRILAQTPDMSQLVPPPDRFPLAVETTEAGEAGVLWLSAVAPRTFLLAGAWSDTGKEAKGPLIQIALDVTSEEETLARYRRWLALVLGLGVLALAGSGVVIARRSLRPLAQITTAAQHITAARLHDRLAPQRWPSELTALVTEFDKMLARLEESFNRLAQFSADIAHELRTPINNLMGEAEVALTRSRTPDEYRQVLGSSLEEYARLARMIDNLLFLARAENTQTKLQKTSFDAVPEVQSVVEFFEPISSEDGVELCFPQAARVPRDSVELAADPILFRRVLNNLVANAMQYTPRGGRVTIAVRLLEDGVAVQVADTGCGIAAEHLPKIFDRFYRVDPSRSQHKHGLGLGLALVKSIMDLHGGTVQVESKVGQGTTITLHFPCDGGNYQI